MVLIDNKISKGSHNISIRANSIERIKPTKVDKDIVNEFIDTERMSHKVKVHIFQPLA